MAQSFRTMLLNPKALHLLRSAASPRNAGCVVVAMAFMAAAAAQVPDSNAIMGFETPHGWIVRGVFTTTATSTTIRTQGNDALAVKDGFLLTTLTSLPVASTATALAGIGASGASFEVDLLPPTVRDNDFIDKFEGSMQMLISSPSRSLVSRRLALEPVGSVDLSTLHPGIYNTVKFPILARIQSALSGASFSDLTFQFVTFPAPSGTSAVWTINLGASESFTNSGGTITDTGSATPVQIAVSNPVSGSVLVTQLTDSSNRVYSFCTPTRGQTVTILPNTSVTQTYTLQGQVTGGRVAAPPRTPLLGYLARRWRPSGRSLL
jgi:hypothetical protein